MLHSHHGSAVSSHSFQHFFFVFFFFFSSEPNAWEVVSHSSFAFPQWLMMLSTFHVLIGHLSIFTEDRSIRSFCPFSNWSLCCCWVVCVFWISSLIRYIICKYFLSLCGSNFYSVEGVFWGQKFQHFMKFNLSILFLLLLVPFRSYSRSLSNLRFWRFCPMLYSKSLIAVGLTS